MKRLFMCVGWAASDGDTQIQADLSLADNAEEVKARILAEMQEKWPGRRYGLGPCDPLPDEHVLIAAASIIAERVEQQAVR